MESNKQPITNPTDEIDLFELLAKAVIIIKNNIVFMVASFLLGSALGLAYYQFSPNIFESKMLISSDILTESYSKSLIDNLDKLIKENNVHALSEKLSLPPERASKIAGIEIKSAMEKPGGTPEKERIYLSVEAKTMDNSIWPQLQRGIIDYLQGNEFVKIRVEQKRKFNNKIIEKIDLELTDLEKLKDRITEGSLTQHTKENLILIDPTTVHSKIIDLNKERIDLQNSLEIVNSVQVVEGFTVFNKPTSPKLSLSLIAGFSFGVFFVALFITFKAVRSVLKFSEEKLGKA